VGDATGSIAVPTSCFVYTQTMTQRSIFVFILHFFIITYSAHCIYA